MSLRLAVDLDGTIADMDAALEREAGRLFGRPVCLRGVEAPAEDDEAGDETTQAAGLTDVELRKLWTHVRGIDNNF